MYYTVNIEARSAKVGSDADLSENVLTALERDGRVAGPAISEDYRAGTIGTTVTIEGEPEPVRAVERAVAAFRDAIRGATGEEAEVVEIEATQEHEEAAALA